MTPVKGMKEVIIRKCFAKKIFLHSLCRLLRGTRNDDHLPECMLHKNAAWTIETSGIYLAVSETFAESTDMHA